MSLAPSFAVASRNKGLNALLETDADGGKLCFYTGTQPASADTALAGNTLLATLTMGSPAFGGASAGVATANAITSASAVATGTATWFRLYKSDNTTAIMDGSLGTSGANINLGTVSIVAGALISVSALTVTQA